MCFCGSLCKFMESHVLGDDYDMRFFMCDNYVYDPPRRYSNNRPRVVHHTILLERLWDLLSYF